MAERREPTIPMSCALVAQYHSHGIPGRGLSWEYNNLYSSMQRVFERAVFFDFDTPYREQGRERMCELLLDFVRRERPELTIVPLFTDEFLPEALDELASYTTTVAYLMDDNWRMDFAEQWVTRFHYFTTPHTWTERRWRERGFGNVILSPFAYDDSTYQKKELEKIYPVSFVGGFHPYRAWLIKRLRTAGIEVAVWGNAWPQGVLPQSRMIEVFNQSKINLNLTDSVSWDLRYLLSSHWAVRNLRASRKRGEQTKGRNFEIPGCGGFQLSYYAEDLEKHFRISDEVAIYHDEDDLLEKVRYYLRHDDEREEIAQAGHARAASEHTFAHRFQDLVRRIDRDGWKPARRSDGRSA
jgi:spore maturation protein CgeB